MMPEGLSSQTIHPKTELSKIVCPTHIEDDNALALSKISTKGVISLFNMLSIVIHVANWYKKTHYVNNLH